MPMTARQEAIAIARGFLPCPKCRSGFLCETHRLRCEWCGDNPTVAATVLERRGPARYLMCDPCFKPWDELVLSVEVLP